MVTKWSCDQNLKNNFTKCIPEVKVNQLKVKNIHVKMGISTFSFLMECFKFFSWIKVEPIHQEHTIQQNKNALFIMVTVGVILSFTP